jgi:hypothetical protein
MPDRDLPRTPAPLVPRSAQILTMLVLLLTAASSLGGLFIEGLYLFPPNMVTATQGQDLVTLVLAVPGTALALAAARRGSVRASIVWIGIMGYIAYSFVGAAFAYSFGPFFLLYVAGFSLSIFALITAIGSVNLVEIQRRFDAGVPRRPVAVFQTLISVLLSLLWLSRIIPNLSNPKPVEVEPYKYVYALDLGIIVPLSLLGALWLWQRKPWGYLLSCMMLIKYATMGLALLSMQLFNLQAGQPLDPAELIGSYVVIAAGGLAMSVWFLRHCRVQ